MASVGKASDTDRIEQQTVVKAPRARVWRALSNPEEFGRWFGVELTGQTLAPGKALKGRVLQPGYEHLAFDVTVERVEPERLLAWRWHPGSTNPNDDYSSEPTTLVVFELDDAAGGGTRVKVTETGFDSLPPERRAQAFRENTDGWIEQFQNLEKHVEQGS